MKQKGNMEKIIKEVLKKYNIKVDSIQAKNLSDFVFQMKEYNKIHNITAITDDMDIIFKHLLDSLLPLEKIQDIYQNNSKNKIKIADIGCGGGFPSVPLAIADNNLNILAIDSVKKKTAFVEQVAKNLNIKNLSVITTRIEDIAHNEKYREQFDIITSRAVAPLNIILEYSAPLLKNNGYIFAYKGSNYLEEIEASTNALKVLDCTIEKTFEYTINEINSKRFVLKIRKNSKIPTKYPRNQNKPRLQPL